MDDTFIKTNHCRKCGNNLEEKTWKSEWHAKHHYKSTICDCCGKKTWIKVHFEGSGDDDWKPQENTP